MRPALRALTAVSLVLASTRPVTAEEAAGEARGKAEAPRSPRNHVNLRVGASSANGNGRPELCLELSPLAILSVEGCGTGSGFLHKDPLPEVAHFRAKLRLLSLDAPAWGTFQPFVSAGFAEEQVGEDDTGFQFGGTDARRVSTTGAELGLGLRWLRPLPFAEGFELLGDLQLGMAYLPHAPELSRPGEAWLPSASLSFGVGF